MSSSPTFIMNPTRGEEEEEMLAIGRGRSHTPPPGSRPSSRLEILMMDLVRSQAEMARSQAEQSRSTEEKLENLARSQAEQSRSTEGKLENLARSQAEQSRSTEGKLESLARSQAEQSQSTKEQIEERFESFARAQSEKLDGLAKGQADLAYAQIGHVAELANIMGRLSSLEVSRHGTPSTSPNPGRRGSPSSAETMHVSVPSINGDLVPLSQAEVRRSERLLLKPRPDYRLLNRSAIRQDKSITAIEEDAEYDDPTPIWRGATLNPIAGEMTFRRGPGDIESREIIREGQDIVRESRIVGPEVNLDLAKKPLHPPVTSFGVAPEVEGSVRRQDVRRSRMARTLTDTDRGRNTHTYKFL